MLKDGAAGLPGGTINAISMNHYYSSGGATLQIFGSDFKVGITYACVWVERGSQFSITRPAVFVSPSLMTCEIPEWDRAAASTVINVYQGSERVPINQSLPNMNIFNFTGMFDQ